MFFSTWHSIIDPLSYLIQKLVEASFDAYYGQQGVYDNYAYHHQIHSIGGTWTNRSTISHKTAVLRLSPENTKIKIILRSKKFENKVRSLQQVFHWTPTKYDMAFNLQQYSSSSVSFTQTGSLEYLLPGPTTLPMDWVGLHLFKYKKSKHKNCNLRPSLVTTGKQLIKACSREW